MRLSVQEAAFDLGAEANRFSHDLKGVGAVVTFTGLVRDNGGQLTAMEIEHYPGMTEKAISAIMEEAVARWGLADALVIHRYGVLRSGEPIMMVATAASHRADAFAAAEWLARRSDVDAGRMGLLGWSNGGTSVLSAARDIRKPRGAARYP